MLDKGLRVVMGLKEKKILDKTRMLRVMVM
jgi:hypothetical protein